MSDLSNLTAHSPTLSGADLIFAQRMLHHVERGATPAEAAQAVIDDDGRLLAAVCAEPYPDLNGRLSRPFRIQGLRDAITNEVYGRLAQVAQ